MIEKYIREDDGHVAVLFTSGTGSGWSSWNDDDLAEWMIMDRELVEMALKGSPESEVKAYISKAHTGRAVHTAGWDKISIRFLPPGTPFAIGEYDGEENVATEDWKPFIA